jgi:hypothetical protein
VALPSKKYVDEFRHLAARAHDQRVRLIAFFPAVVEVTATRHLEAAPFAFDGVQTADVLRDLLLLGFPSALCLLHAANLSLAADNGCRR